MLLLFSALALAQVAPSPSPTGDVTAVTVFADRATVTREVSVSLSAGENTVVFRDLPPSLDGETLLAAGQGDATIRGLEIERRELAEDRRARVQALQARLEQVADARQAQQDVKAAAAAELAFVTRLGAAAAKQLSSELMFVAGTTEDADGLAALVRTRVTAANTDVRGADQAIRALDAERDALGRELREVQGARQWARVDVTVLVDAARDHDGVVTLSYTLPGASWTPSWDARAEPGADTVEMALSAQVTQTTGEDWRGVALTLSTARPAGGVKAPELSPFWLSSGYASGRVDADGSLVDSYVLDEPTAAAEGGAPATVSAMTVLRADVTARPVASTFAVPGASSVSGDGGRRKLAVTDVAVAATWRDVVVPELDEQAWIVAEGTWSEAWSLIGGPVSLFAGDAYVGSMTLPTSVGRGGHFELGFGPDDALHVVRVPVEDLRAGAGQRGHGTVTRTWTTTVSSGRTSPVDVSLRQRLPVSTDAQWRVRPLGDEPAAVEDQGLVRWERTLGSGEEWVVTSGWRVRFPNRNPPGGL